MWVIVGLGNPGSKYSHTRHNVGFLVVEELARKFGLTFADRKQYRFCRGAANGNDFIILEPLTFMNRSGDAVRSFASRFCVSTSRIVVIHDDLDIEVGRLKIRENGSSGGQKGVASIIERLGSRDFLRIKVGIGRDPDIPAEKYVLSRFSREEAAIIRRAIPAAAEAAVKIMEKGVSYAMNMFNKAGSIQSLDII